MGGCCHLALEMQWVKKDTLMSITPGGTGLTNDEGRIKPLRPLGGSAYEPDMHEVAERAIIFGSGAVTQEGAIAAGEEGILIDTRGGAFIEGSVRVTEGDFVGKDQYSINILPYSIAYERVVGFTAFVLNQLELGHKQTREQSQGWFRFSLIAAGIGFTLIGIGVIVVMFGQVTAGFITAISSVIPHTAAALFFVQAKAANERVDAIQTRLADAREVQTAVEIVNTIDDLGARDKLKAEIVRKVLQLKKESSTDDK